MAFRARNNTSLSELVMHCHIPYRPEYYWGDVDSFSLFAQYVSIGRYKCECH